MSYAPLVSCVLATGGRPGFLAQAIRCFRRQRYANRELIVVDDGPIPSADSVPPDPTIRYLRLGQRTALGAKLNLAIDQAGGEIIQKLDDDDYYAPDMLDAMVSALSEQDPLRAVAGLDCFLVLIAASGHVTFSGHGWFAGNSLCFHRSLWARRAFREVAAAEDWWFLRDHQPILRRVCRAELCIVVRHDQGHTWVSNGREDVTAAFARRAAVSRPLSALVQREDLAFYGTLRAADATCAP
jgi:glycosyltransferase involved in cell wall biosynthesis